MSSYSNLKQSPSIQSEVEFSSILDGDTVELFNIETMYHYNQQNSWLGFIHEKRLAYRRLQRKITMLIYSLMSFFAIMTVAFWLMAILKTTNGGGRNFANDINGYDDYAANLDKIEYHKQVEHYEQCHQVAPEARIDCNPDPPIERARCESRGCCWNPINEQWNYTAMLDKFLPPVNVPYCYFANDYFGYEFVQKSSFQSSQSHNMLELKRVRSSGFDSDVEIVRIDIQELDGNSVRIKLVDSNKKRYQVSVPKLNLPPAQPSLSAKLYEVKLHHENMTLAVHRIETGAIVFSLHLAWMIYSDQFIQVNSRLPSDFFYGIGEHREPFRKTSNWKRYTMFNRDQYPLPDMALYGAHPFYMSVEEYASPNHPASGVFLFNSNAMDLISQPEPSITFRTIGGVLDFFVFLGPRPDDVLQQYHRLIGLPQMPPYWSLGFHLSRFGYRNMSSLQATFERNRDEQIPYDVQWTDIDIMSSNNDFTYDTKNFKNLPQFIELLHKIGMRYIPMFDCGISAGDGLNYEPYRDGLNMNVFMRNVSGDLFLGKVWNRKSTVWPDFSHPNASRYWSKWFAAYHQQLSFDGAWIDMNEPSNFYDGQENGCGSHRLEQPPYTPGMSDDSLSLRHKTLCMTARHYLDVWHYDMHNLYGFQEAITTNQALKKVLANKRPFIISRSTAPGHGHYASHWTGDILSDWSSMKWSISSILNFNLFGIPMVGADICGFNGNTTEELCARWHQLGAFYTFARNHNTDDAIDQDPVALGSHVIEAARNALLMRYAHLPYLYTLFHKVHKSGGAVLRPLFFEFPHDQWAYKIDAQFLWGSSIMIAPALSPNQTKIEVYFPKGNWFFAGNYRYIESRGESLPQNASMSYPNVFYRAGSIIPVQIPKQTTDATRKGNFNLIVVLDDQKSNATGELYWDAGDGLDTEELGTFNQYIFQVQKSVLKIKSQYLGYQMDQKIQDIVILGFYNRPSLVLVNEKTHKFNYDAKYCRLTLNELKLSLYDDSKTGSIHHQIEWR